MDPVSLLVQRKIREKNRNILLSSPRHVVCLVYMSTAQEGFA
jgi:hypothetical protein